MSIVRNLIIIADVCHSIQFLAWREEDASLTVISKDMDSQTVLAAAFIHDGSQLGMLVGDDEGNLQVFQYDPRYEK